MTPKDATDEELRAVIGRYALDNPRLDGEAERDYYDRLVLGVLKRGQSIERARLIEDIKMWSATCRGMPYHIHNELCEKLNGLLTEIEAA